MTWMLQTDQNKQNSNAGNGGDLVKHTVYLTLLDELLKRDPWRSDIRLRECHVGRGIYRPAPATVRTVHALMERGCETMLARAQSEALDRLGVRNPQERGDFYVGSAVLNLLALESSQNPKAEYYEYEPRTRNALEEVLRSANHNNDRLSVSIPGEHRRRTSHRKFYKPVGSERCRAVGSVQHVAPVTASNRPRPVQGHPFQKRGTEVSAFVVLHLGSGQSDGNRRPGPAESQDA
jgi:hypothetical protein